MKPRRIWVNEFKSGLSDVLHYQKPSVALSIGLTCRNYVRTVEFIEVVPKKKAKVKK